MKDMKLLTLSAFLNQAAIICKGGCCPIFTRVTKPLACTDLGASLVRLSVWI